MIGLVTVGRWVNQHPRSTQPGHPFMGRHDEYQRKLRY